MILSNGNAEDKGRTSENALNDMLSSLKNQHSDLRNEYTDKLEMTYNSMFLKQNLEIKLLRDQIELDKQLKLQLNDVNNKQAIEIEQLKKYNGKIPNLMDAKSHENSN